MQCAIIYKNILTYYYNLEWLLCQTVSFLLHFLHLCSDMKFFRVHVIRVVCFRKTIRQLSGLRFPLPTK